MDIRQSSGGAGLPCMWRKSGITQGRFGMFIGCINYPECEHTELSINRTKQQLHAPNVGRAICPAPLPLWQNISLL